MGGGEMAHPPHVGVPSVGVEGTWAGGRWRIPPMSASLRGGRGGQPAASCEAAAAKRRMTSPAGSSATTPSTLFPAWK